MLEVGRPYSRWLRKIEHSVALSDDDRILIAQLPMTVRNIESGREIAAPGERSNNCYLVLDGYLYEHKTVGAQGRQIIHLHVPGDMADLPSLHLPSPDYRLSAMGSTVVASLPHSAIRATVKVSSALDTAFKIQSNACEAILRERVVNLGKRDAAARIAHTVCELAIRLQLVGLAPDLCFGIAWTQADLSDLTGISTVHTNRVVQELRRIGALDWGPKRIRIGNWDQLAEIGDFSPAYLDVAPRKDVGIRRGVAER